MTENALQSAPAAPATSMGPRERTALVLLLAATFVVFLNETTMSVAIPHIADDFGVTPSTGQWLTTAFALTMAVVIPITGWLLERVQTRPVFIAALSIFSAGTILAIVAPAFGVLVAARVVQGMGTAIMMPLMMTSVLALVPPSERGRIMGRIAIVMSLAPAVGPTVSGLILDAWGWRAVFLVMLPIALVMLGIGIARIPNIAELARVPLDVPSAVLSAVGFASLVYGFSAIGNAAEGNAAITPWIPITVGVVALAGFVARQLLLQRRDGALLDLRTFTYRPFLVAIISLTIAMVSLFGLVLVLPYFLSRTLGLDALATGLTILPGAVLMGVSGPLVGRLYDRFGPRPLVIPGAIIVAAAFWALSFVSATTPWWAVVIAMISINAGLALLFTPMFTAGLGALPRRLYSHGSATVATVQQVGGAAGAALFAAFYSIGAIAAGAADPSSPSPVESAAGAHLAFLAGAIAATGLVVATLFMRREDNPEGDAPHGAH